MARVFISTIAGADVAAAIGRPDDAKLAQLADIHIPLWIETIRVYTRGVGFDDEQDTMAAPLYSVLVTALSRYLSNPEQIVSATAGTVSQRYVPFDGWTLTERITLDSYRRKSA